jgi:hypothetical protein
LLVNETTVTGIPASAVPAPGSQVWVFYDGGCPLCVMLADFSRKKMAHVTDVSFSASAEPNPPEIVVQIRSENMIRNLVGKDAWSWLLEHHPSLREIHWVASKLGLTSEVGAVMRRSTDFLRKFCLRCR